MISLVSMNRCWYVLLFLLSLLHGVNAQSLTDGQIPEYASVSALVIDLETGKELFNYDADRLLVPASLMKLVSTAVALEKLGPGFQFITRIWQTGEVKRGTLHGNLIIEGGGDPTFGSRYFSHSSPGSLWIKIRQYLETAGIEKLNGKIWIDEHLFDAPRFPSARLWEDMGNYYGAPPSALSFRDNTFELTLQSPPAVGELCRVVGVNPQWAPANFVCRVRSATLQKDSAYIYGIPGLAQWEIRGSIPAGRSAFTIKGALPWPGIVFGHELAFEVFKSSDIVVEATSDTRWKEHARLLGEIKSPPLSAIVGEINRQSNNLMADHLLPALAAQTGRQSSFWDEGPRIIKEFWQKRDIRSYTRITDASGLSPSNAISARFLVQVLHYMYKSPNSREYVNSLAVSGSKGTLVNMWNTPLLKGQIRAKSGSMNNVMGYAGYFLQPSSSPKIFAIIVNHHGLPDSQMRQIIEKKVEEMLR